MCGSACTVLAHTIRRKAHTLAAEVQLGYPITRPGPGEDVDNPACHGGTQHIAPDRLAVKGGDNKIITISQTGAMTAKPATGSGSRPTGSLDRPSGAKAITAAGPAPSISPQPNPNRDVASRRGRHRVHKSCSPSADRGSSLAASVAAVDAANARINDRPGTMIGETNLTTVQGISSSNSPWAAAHDRVSSPARQRLIVWPGVRRRRSRP